MRRRVLIDSSFVSALLDRSDVRHERARVAFGRLLDEFESGMTVLYGSDFVSGDIADARVADLLAVCDIVRPRRWLTREAERVVRDHPDVGWQRATTLALMSRCQIDEIASFDHFFEQYAIRTVGC